MYSNTNGEPLKYFIQNRII